MGVLSKSTANSPESQSVIQRETAINTIQFEVKPTLEQQKNCKKSLAKMDSNRKTMLTSFTGQQMDEFKFKRKYENEKNRSVNNQSKHLQFEQVGGNTNN